MPYPNCSATCRGVVCRARPCRQRPPGRAMRMGVPSGGLPPSASPPALLSRASWSLWKSRSRSATWGCGGEPGEGGQGDGGAPAPYPPPQTRGSAHPVAARGCPQQQPPPGEGRRHGGARAAPSGSGRTPGPAPGRAQLPRLRSHPRSRLRSGPRPRFRPRARPPPGAGPLLGVPKGFRTAGARPQNAAILSPRLQLYLKMTQIAPDSPQTPPFCAPAPRVFQPP